MGYPRWQREKMAEEAKRRLAESAEAAQPEPEQVAEPEPTAAEPEVTGHEASEPSEAVAETGASTEEPVQNKPRRAGRKVRE